VHHAVLEVLIEAEAEAFDRIGRRRPVLEGAIEGGEAVVDDAADQRRLVPEVVIDRRRRDARADADLADREAVFADARKQLLRSGEDGSPGRLGPLGAGAELGRSRHGETISAIYS